jgi:hypothetical protein
MLRDEKPSESDKSGLEAVTARAALDPAFRQRLLQSPHLAIREAFGLELPGTFRIRFIERGSDVDLLVVLPEPIADVGEATEQELRGTTGGVASISGDVALLRGILWA